MCMYDELLAAALSRIAPCYVVFGAALESAHDWLVPNDAQLSKQPSVGSALHDVAPINPPADGHS